MAMIRTRIHISFLRVWFRSYTTVGYFSDANGNVMSPSVKKLVNNKPTV